MRSLNWLLFYSDDSPIWSHAFCAAATVSFAVWLFLRQSSASHSPTHFAGLLPRQSGKSSRTSKGDELPSISMSFPTPVLQVNLAWRGFKHLISFFFFVFLPRWWRISSTEKMVEPSTSSTPSSSQHKMRKTSTSDSLRVDRVQLGNHSRFIIVFPLLISVSI